MPDLIETTIEIHDDRFRALVDRGARLERLHTGCGFSEGPAYFTRGRYLVWSDISKNRMLRLDEVSGAVEVFRQPSEYANGNTVDRQGRLVTCEHATRRVTRTEHDGSITVIADSYQGNRLNSPNDIVEKSDGTLWFTDPTYGIDTPEDGPELADSELDGRYVFRVDPRTGEIRVVADDFVMPNGLAFSRDERQLYIVDSGRTHGPGKPQHIRVFDVSEDGTTLSGGDFFATCTAELFDGFRIDDAGHLWVGCSEGVHCYHPDGALLGKVRVPEFTANVEFGGPRRNRLYLCGSTSLYAVDLHVTGAASTTDAGRPNPARNGGSS